MHLIILLSTISNGRFYSTSKLSFTFGLDGVYLIVIPVIAFFSLSIWWLCCGLNIFSATMHTPKIERKHRFRQFKVNWMKWNSMLFSILTELFSTYSRFMVFAHSLLAFLLFFKLKLSGWREKRQREREREGDNEWRQSNILQFE